VLAQCRRVAQPLASSPDASGTAGAPPLFEGRGEWCCLMVMVMVDDATNRAMEGLSVDLIAAQSPQAKGRVERINGTLQDRLLKAMRLEGISDIEQANDYLAKTFLADFNRRYMRVEAQSADRHLAKPKELNEVLSWEEDRVVQRDWTVKWKNKQYQLNRRHESLSLVDKTITVRLLHDESLQMVYRGKKLKRKELSAEAPRVREAEKKPEPKKRQVPAVNHPWRRMGRANAQKA
jgi:hypothetical protein